MNAAGAVYSENITNETRLTRIQALVVEILSDLLRSPIEATDAAVHRAISRIGAYARRDRSYVFVKRDGLVFNTHEWCAGGIEPAIDQLQGLPWEAYGPISQPLDLGQPFHVPDVAVLPPGSEARTLLEGQQIRSILAVPMRDEGQTYGFIGFDGVEHTHAFLPGEVYLLQSVADVICTVLTRRDRELAVRAAQAELAEERAFLKSVLSTSAVGVMVLDGDGIFRFANDAAEAISGVRRDMLIGAAQSDPRWLITREDGVTPFQPGEWPFDLVMATGQPVKDIRFGLHCPEGLRYISIHAAPVAPGTARQARVVYAMVDVTDQVRAEHARAEALEDARRANTTKSNFLAKMSHEMRTPLNGVLGIAEVLARQITDPDQHRMVKVLHDSGSLLLGIINDLLDMTKIEADQLELEQVAFDMGEMAQRLEAVHTLKAAEKQLSFGVQLLGAPSGPRLGDPYRLLQILHNLIGNAIKFTEQGAVSVEIDCRSPARILLDVRDTGIGMTPEAVATVFEDFGQADSTIARRFGGTGLGMPIVKRLVAMMGGTIRLDSQPGQGTRVTIDLPLPVAQADDLARVPVGDTEGLPDLSSLRVLAADDNRTNRMILGAMLGQLGVSAVMVGDGHSAIRTFDADRFDVVILDISMPDIDGIEVMKALRTRLAERAGPAAESPAILAFTANAMAHQVEAYLQAGFDACLTKPLQLPRLATALLATKSGGAAALAATRRRGLNRRRLVAAT
jgi:signal transduction histidine kinase/CheY-like chemotaxis protein/GAF domain-containing protein